MKTILALLALIASSVLLPAQIDGRVTLQWDYPLDELDGVTFTVYHTTNAAAPVSDWAPIASITATNRIPLTVIPGRNFFACTASNFWGESVPSNVAATPPLPRSDINLSIRRGH